MKNTTKKNVKKSKQKPSYLPKIIVSAVIAVLAGLGCTFVIINNQDGGHVEVKIEYASEQSADLGENEEFVPTIEEIDGGGKFQDQLNVTDGEPAFYYELGNIEEVNTSSPEAFKKSTLGRCIVANNYYGAQCVSLARAFWWDYAGFDVSTCGTGLAKGMMNCAEENAKNKFKIIWNKDEIQAGTWIVLDGQSTGHICMALSSPVNGYVSCLGENQGGIACEGGIGGSGTNIINISLKNFIGGYTPLDYIEPEPAPEPTPTAPDTGKLK